MPQEIVVLSDSEASSSGETDQTSVYLLEIISELALHATGITSAYCLGCSCQWRPLSRVEQSLISDIWRVSGSALYYPKGAVVPYLLKGYSLRPLCTLADGVWLDDVIVNQTLLMSSLRLLRRDNSLYPVPVSSFLATKLLAAARRRPEASPAASGLPSNYEFAIAWLRRSFDRLSVLTRNKEATSTFSPAALFLFRCSVRALNKLATGCPHLLSSISSIRQIPRLVRSVLLPLNVASSHWSLLVVYPELRLAVLIDSFSACPLRSFSRAQQSADSAAESIVMTGAVLRVFSSMLLQEMGCHFSGSPRGASCGASRPTSVTWHVVSAPLGVQHSSDDCGVFCVAVASVAPLVEFIHNVVHHTARGTFHSMRCCFAFPSDSFALAPPLWHSVGSGCSVCSAMCSEVVSAGDGDQTEGDVKCECTVRTRSAEAKPPCCGLAFGNVASCVQQSNIPTLRRLITMAICTFEGVTP